MTGDLRKNRPNCCDNQGDVMEQIQRLKRRQRSLIICCAVNLVALVCVNVVIWRFRYQIGLIVENFDLVISNFELILEYLGGFI